MEPWLKSFGDARVSDVVALPHGVAAGEHLVLL
jgi:hypothetical protein